MVNEDRSVAAKGIPMWSGEIKDFKGWYTQFSAYCSTIEEGSDVITLLMRHKSDLASLTEIWRRQHLRMLFCGLSWRKP